MVSHACITVAALAVAIFTSVIPGNSAILASGAYCLADMRVTSTGALFAVVVVTTSCTLTYLYTSMIRAVRAVRRAAPARQSDSEPTPQGETRPRWGLAVRALGRSGARVQPAVSGLSAASPPLRLDTQSSGNAGAYAIDVGSVPRSPVAPATARDSASTPTSQVVCSAASAQRFDSRCSSGSFVAPTPRGAAAGASPRAPRARPVVGPTERGAWRVGRVALTLTMIFVCAWAPTMAMAVAVQATGHAVPPAVDIFTAVAIHVCFAVSAAVQVRLHRAYRRELARVVGLLWTAAATRACCGRRRQPPAPPAPRCRRLAATIATPRVVQASASSDVDCDAVAGSCAAPLPLRVREWRGRPGGRGPLPQLRPQPAPCAAVGAATRDGIDAYRVGGVCGAHGSDTVRDADLRVGVSVVGAVCGGAALLTAESTASGITTERTVLVDHQCGATRRTSSAGSSLALGEGAQDATAPGHVGARGCAGDDAAGGTGSS